MGRATTSGSASPALTGPKWFASGITAERPTCWQCTWAWRGDLGKMAVKVAHAQCPEHGHLAPAAAAVPRPSWA